MRGLNRTQLKVIAICAMVCDHVAWGFVDFMTPLGQLMHIIGRFTIPIMCFFIAEGFRHTSSRKEYIKRMVLFWIVAIVPFYLFFHEMYEYRQNIIFDLLLGLLMLAVLENKNFKIWCKVLLGACLFLVSAYIGGWPILPILFILAFYYGKDFKSQALWICGLTVALEVFLIVAVTLNRSWHFSHYDWPWYEKLYFLGFMLPLFLLKHYNGQKGKNIIGKYFFYLFYPAHFLVLAAVKAISGGCTLYQFYVAVHVIALAVCLGVLLLVLFARPSRGQAGTLVLVLSACVYTFGFLLEIISKGTEGCYTATMVQYLGESLLMIGFTIFVNEMCHRPVPGYVYALESLCGIITMWMLMTTRENHIFYTFIGMDESGPFPRLVLHYGWGFQFFVVYLIAVCLGCFIVCLLGMKNAVGVEKKRIMCTAIAIAFPWLPNFIRSTGITGGYEIPCIGIMGAVILVGLSMTKYGYFDAVTLAGENALHHGNEGIMVVNSNYIITYYNKRMEEIFGKISLKHSAYKNQELTDIFHGKIKTLEREGQIYEMRVEPLMESGYIQGYMLWALDITEHHHMLIQISNLAHKDSMTGIYNRSYFITLLEEYLAQGGEGALFMMDLDNFKQVNDRFGHLAGDSALIKFGQVLSELKEDVIPCRIGGDEFCIFAKGITENKELERMARQIAADFKKKQEGEKYDGIMTVSIGIAVTTEISQKGFEKLYSNADKALYVAKNRSKNTYYIL